MWKKNFLCKYIPQTEAYQNNDFSKGKLLDINFLVHNVFSTKEDLDVLRNSSGCDIPEIIGKKILVPKFL